ncbi:DNA/RNA non-specific endonuclease [Mycetocola saprophilus]|uniref:DNA/RNA non-specific endonuclease n=1 Tax=Mycetocola saprophilus TaxID=76636 RepID=UPI003BF14B87
MSNALIAQAQEQTTPFSGLWLIEDGQGLSEAIKNGDWISGGLSAFGALADTAAAILDPIGQLIGMGLAWVIDHISPIKDWFNDLTGNAAEVSAFADTWTNIAGRMRDSGDLMRKRLSDMDGMSGMTVDAYLAYAEGLSTHLGASGDWAEAIATGMRIASTIVQTVHDLARDAISQIVGTAASAALTTAATLGFGAPVAIAQVTTRVASLSGKVGHAVDKLKTAIRALQDLVRKLQELMEKAAGVFAGAVTRSPRTTRQTANIADEVTDAARTAGRSTTPPHGRFDPPPTSNRVKIDAADGPGPRTTFGNRTDLEPNTHYSVEGRGEFYTNESGRVVHVEAEYGTRGNINWDLRNPQPDATYVVHPVVTNPQPGVNYAHVFETDELARTKTAYTENLAEGDAYRSPSMQRRIGDLGGDGYEGGHIFGRSFGGGPEDINMVAMTEKMNRGGGDTFFNFEAKLRALAKNDAAGPIELHLEPFYSGDSLVPDGILAKYRIDSGQIQEEVFLND